MERHTLEILEFEKIRRLLAAFSSSPLGKQRALRIRPIKRVESIRERIEEVGEMRRLLKEAERLPLAGIRDIRRAVRKAAKGGDPLLPKTLLETADTLRAADAIRETLEELGPDFPRLTALGERIEAFRDLYRPIEQSIDDSGNVRDEATPELSELRHKTITLRSAINSKMQRLMESPEYRDFLQFESVTISEHRYVMPIKAEHRGRVEGIVHGASDSGQTLYLEPSPVVELGNELSETVSREAEEVKHILLALTRSVGARCREILDAIDALGLFDLLYAKARLSLAYNMSAPEIVEDGGLEIHGARHPILLMLTCEGPEPLEPKPDSVVPIDARVGDDFDVLVITGPNTGGKTVSLKTIGLCCLMAQSGLYVPAEPGSRFPAYRNIFADIGDEQSIEQSLSTFSSHMSRIIEILHKANRQTLVLLDELGAGTDPAEGAGLGRAVLEVLETKHVPTFATTHLGTLKSYAYSRPRVENASVEFDTATLRPTYRLLIGQPGTSNALTIAERLGLHKDVIMRARQLVQQQSKELTRLIEGVHKSRLAAEEKRREAEKFRREAAALKVEHQERLAKLKRGKMKEEAVMAKRVAELLGKLNEKTAAMHAELRNSHHAVARQIKGLNEMIREELDLIERRDDGLVVQRPLKVGDEAFVPKIEKWGEVVEIDERRDLVRLQMGQVKLEVKRADVSRWMPRMR